MTTSPQGTAPSPLWVALNTEKRTGTWVEWAQRVRQRLGRFGKGLGDAFGHLFGDPKADLLAELTEQAPMMANLIRAPRSCEQYSERWRPDGRRRGHCSRGYGCCAHRF